MINDAEQVFICLLSISEFSFAEYVCVYVCAWECWGHIWGAICLVSFENYALGDGMCLVNVNGREPLRFLEEVRK